MIPSKEEGLQLTIHIIESSGGWRKGVYGIINQKNNVKCQYHHL
jgi:hypothetical protein